MRDPTRETDRDTQRDTGAVRTPGVIAAHFIGLLPALLLAMLVIRVAELGSGFAANSSAAEIARIVGAALLADALAVLRHLPLVFAYSLPILWLRSRRALFGGLFVGWSALLLVQAALAQYFLTAREPLGADLFAYSWHDIRQTAGAGANFNAVLWLGAALSIGVLYLMLRWLTARARNAPSGKLAALAFAVSLALLLFTPSQPSHALLGSDDAYNLALNKPAFFFDDSVGYLLRTQAPTSPRTATTRSTTASAPIAGFQYLDPRYPFLHAENTPDALGPHFALQPGTPPNLVFIIVEGLGRSFSGPDAALGSFTPFLDQLGARSLYWENFLATQGRTFAALPSIFASLPYGDKGVNALGDAMPGHDSLLSVLKAQGYRLKFYCGSDLDFDNQRSFLRRQGVDVLLGRDDFGKGYVHSPGNNSWGYADRELVERTLADAARDSTQPFVSVLQTITTHTPYTFPAQANYYPRFEQRLDQLGISSVRKPGYRDYRDIYASLLYVDDALRFFFEQAEHLPGYQNTIFVITGDHRLPEIPLGTRIDRYHVPLIIFSPMLKEPLRIKSVSSHFDIAPSLLALLAHNYGVRTPSAVTWLGSGLDMTAEFRNVHEFPMKQSKHNLVDFISGTRFLSLDNLYSLADGMHIEPLQDAVAMADVQGRFAAFRAANDQFARTNALLPAGSAALAPANLQAPASV
ncbi:MAG: LTA synthase family protein, partial [Arenimonas sp.]